MPGAIARLELEVTDADCNPLDAEEARIRIGTTGDAVVAASAKELVLADHAATGEAVIYAGPLTARVPVTVIAAPAQVRAEPSTALAMPGDVLRFAAELLDDAGHILAQPEDLRATFTCAARLGAIGQDGALVVAEGATTDSVSVRMAGAEGEARVVVAQPVSLDADEARERLHFAVYPLDGPEGDLQPHADPRASGGECMALAFRLGDVEATRAAYARADAPVGRAIGITARLRAEGDAPWVRVAYRDGNDTRATVTLVERLAPSDDFQLARLRLPDGTKPPVVFESIYVVETDTARHAAGTLFVDDLTAWVIGDGDAD